MAIKYQPGDVAAWAGRCWAQALSGQPKPALADCSEVIRLKPDDGAGFALRGFAYLKLADYDHAIDDYGMALWFTPKDALALYGRGMARLKKGDKGGSEDIAASKALRRDVAELFVKYGVK
jgi:tetratricopeptide (TPR) repeat protein